MPTTPAVPPSRPDDPSGDKGGRGLFGKLGPGLITGAADDDPSGIATYTQAGAQFGYALGWTLFITFPLMVGIQLASARIGRATGKGLVDAFAHMWPRPVVAAALALLVVANIFNLAADLSAMAEVSSILLGGNDAFYTLGFGALSLSLQAWVPYHRYVRVLKWLTLALLSYVGVVLVSHVDWAAAMRGALWPRVSADAEAVKMVVAILGTTISPYLFFWQASQEVEEMGRTHVPPLKSAPALAPGAMRRMRWDTFVGMGFSNGIALCMMVAAAATLHAHGQTVSSTREAAQALRPIAGEAAFALFAVGILGTGLLALPVLAGSAAYACAEFLGVRRGLERPVGAAPAFYAILAVAMVMGVAISLSDLDAMTALVWAAVLNAVMATPIMVGVMLAASSTKVMGRFTLPRLWRALGWLATGAMAASCLTLAWLGIG